jgi:rSAM/selenodomain-associated transferase 1
MGSIAVIIMAKAPQAGEVKTRLCPPLSPAEAAELYGCFLLDTLAKVRELAHVHAVIAYAPTSRREFFARIAPDFTLLPQQGPDLGARMANCFAALFARGSSQVLLIGSDLPTLPVAYIQQAIASLTRPQVDVVLGPSEDGGYYLIGLRQPHDALFEDMPWSTAQVFARTRQRAEATGLHVVCLPPWYDIDVPAELERLRVVLDQTAGPMPYYTRRFLRRQTG